MVVDVVVVVIVLVRDSRRCVIYHERRNLSLRNSKLGQLSRRTDYLRWRLLVEVVYAQGAVVRCRRGGVCSQGRLRLETEAAEFVVESLHDSLVLGA